MSVPLVVPDDHNKNQNVETIKITSSHDTE